MRGVLRAACLIILPLLLCCVRSSAPAQPDMSKMRTYVLGLAYKGPAWTEIADSARHLLGASLMGDGSVVGAGPVFNDDRLLGMFIFPFDSTETAERRIAQEPAVTAGVYAFELHRWYSIRGIGEGLAAARTVRRDSIPPLMPYQLGLIKRGAAWSPEDTPERARIQAGHMANIERLANEGKLVMAGPMMDDGPWRGIFVYRVDSRREAEELAASDPAVQAGRLAVELYDWKAPAGVTPRPDTK